MVVNQVLDNNVAYLPWPEKLTSFDIPTTIENALIYSLLLLQLFTKILSELRLKLTNAWIKVYTI